MALNPYRDWLEIGESEARPDHYALLGLPLFEGDPATIHAAYGRRMEVARRYQMGTHMEVAQRVISELSEAYVALTHPDQKAEYDRALHAPPPIQNDPHVPLKAVSRPWDLALACLQRCVDDDDGAALEQGEAFAALADRTSGRSEFMRQALKRGIYVERYHRALSDLARQQSAAVCGNCYEFVPNPDASAAQVALDRSGMLHTPLFSIRQTNLLFWTELALEWKTPQVHDLELGTCISRGGALAMAFLLAAVPLACNVLAGMAGLPGTEILSGLLLLVGLATLVLLTIFHRPRLTTALDAAWEIVVPYLLQRSPDRETEELLVGLARASEQHGNIPRRGEGLDAAIQAYDTQLPGEPARVWVLTALLRLKLSDLIVQGKQGAAVALLHKLVSRCLLGELPVICLDEITKDGSRLGGISLGQRVLLKWRLYQACEKLGLSVVDVLQLATCGRFFATFLASDPPATLKSVSHAYALMQAADEIGSDRSVKTAIECLSDKQSSRELEHFPAAIAWADDRTAYVSAEGLCFAGQRFTKPPLVAIEPIYGASQGPPNGLLIGHRLQVDNYSVEFRGRLFGDGHMIQAHRAASRITLLSALLFTHVRPRANRLIELPGSGKLSTLRRQRPAKCPHCQRVVQFEEGAFAAPGG